MADIVNPIAQLINSTPELKKKLAGALLVQVGQKYYVVDPQNVGIHAVAEGKYKGLVFQCFQVSETLDVKGNEFKPTPRGRRNAKVDAAKK